MQPKEKINILLVDDLPENLLVTEAILDKEEYNLVKTTSGEEAIKALLMNDFALILLDVQMPGMDGFTTAKIIKAREKTKHIPILFITANNMESEHISMGYSVGAIDYILKPVDPLILKAKVEGFVAIHRLKQQLMQQKNQLTATNNDLKETSRKLHISETLANVISETSKDSMLVLDQFGAILKANPSTCSQLQREKDDLLGTNIRSLFTTPKSKQFIENIFTKLENYGHLSGRESQRELEITKQDGTTFLSDVYIGLQQIENTMVIAMTIRDITQEKENEALIKHMAYHDVLTDLPNRRALTENLLQFVGAARDKNKPFGLLYLDIDRFKYINDSLGQAMGDRVIQALANRLGELLRGDDFIAHLGGDEFAIVLPDKDREQALAFADEIMNAFQEVLVVNNYELYITTSMGLSMFPYDGEVSEELIRNALIALHKAKEQGKNSYHIYHTGMNIQTYRSFMMQNDFRKAIENEEFKLHYQPRYDVTTGKIQSAEALLRWEHPSWGAVSPAEFIPLAEDTGQITKIGEWVFQTACEQIKAWDEKGLPKVRVAINFSANQFLQKDLIAFMTRVIAETGIEATSLEVEITESMLIENEDITINTLNKIRELGILISLDDFGTGYSSLTYLSKLPVDILKIDKAFIKDVELPSSVNHSITKMIIVLAKALDLAIVAEGVETQAQCNFLKEQGSNEIQGYFFSAPLEVDAFETILLKPSYEGMKKDNRLELGEREQAATKESPISFALGKLKKQHQLSRRESEVFEQIVAGLTNKEISQKLFISEHTVKNHISNIFQKLSVTDRSQAMAMVYRFVVEN